MAEQNRLFRVGRVLKFPRNEHVDILIREIVFAPDTDDEKPYVEIREYLKGPGIYGHGILLPDLQVPDLVQKLGMLGKIPAANPQAAR